VYFFFSFPFPVFEPTRPFFRSFLFSLSTSVLDPPFLSFSFNLSVPPDTQRRSGPFSEPVPFAPPLPFPQCDTSVSPYFFPRKLRVYPMLGASYLSGLWVSDPTVRCEFFVVPRPMLFLSPWFLSLSNKHSPRSPAPPGFVPE